MKKLSAFLLLIVTLSLLLCSSAALAASADDYRDMPAQTDWSYDALTSAIDNGLLSGRGDGFLAPQSALTRAEMAAIIGRAFGAENKASLAGYTDVPADAWYADDMALAVGMGIFQGHNGQLRPEDVITREEAFVVLSRAFAMRTGGTSLSSRFADANAVSAWAAEALSAMAAAGYVSGSNGQVNPLNNITRAEFAQVMDNMVAQYITKPGVYTDLPAGNVLIRCSGVTLSNTALSGDLILGDGAGDVTLENVSASGRIVVRGGDLELENSSAAALIVEQEGVTVTADEESSIDEVEINASNTTLTGDGEIGAVDIDPAAENVKIGADVTPASGGGGSADKLTASMIQDLQFEITFSPVGADDYTRVYAANSFSSTIDISGEPATAEIVSGKISGTLNGKQAQMTFDPGYGSGFALNTSYTIAQFMGAGTQYLTSNFTVGGLRTLLNDDEGNNKTNWAQASGKNWPSSVSYNPSPTNHTATVSGRLSAAGYSGTVAYTLHLAW